MAETKRETQKSSTDLIPGKQSKSVQIALVGMLAGIYAVATLALGIIAFGPLNLRFSNILIGVVPIVGWPAVLGLSLGVFLGNIGSSLGPIDLLSALFSLIGLTAINILRRRSVLAGLTIYSAILSVWVTFEISYVVGIPYFPLFYGVAGGISFIVIGLGYLFYRALKASGLTRRVESVSA